MQMPVATRIRLGNLCRLLLQPTVLIVAPITYALGVITVLPLGVEVSEHITSAISAGVTAVATVGGAMAVWHYQEAKKERAIGMAFNTILQLPLDQMQTVENSCEQNYLDSVDHSADRRVHISDMRAVLDDMIDYIEEMRALVPSLKPDAGARILADLPRCMRQLNRQLGLLDEFSKSVSEGLPKPTLGRGWLFEINRFRRMAGYFAQTYPIRSLDSGRDSAH
jgi:hypothetical protein